MAEFQMALCNANYLRYPFERFLDSQQKLGRTRIALYGSVPHLLIDHYDYRESAVLGEHLKIRGFTVDAFIPAGYGYSLFARQGTDYFAASRNYYCNCVRACRNVGAATICIRPCNGQLSQKSDTLIASCMEMMKDILNTAKAEGVRVALGTARSEDAAALWSLPSLKACISMIDEANLGALLDTHIMSLADETIEDWIAAFPEKLFYVHMADGRKGGYRVWGEGVYPMEAYVRALKKHGYEKNCAYFLMGNTDVPEQADVLNHQAAAMAEEETGC